MLSVRGWLNQFRWKMYYGRFSAKAAGCLLLVLYLGTGRAHAQELQELQSATNLEGFNASCMTTLTTMSHRLIGLSGDALNGAATGVYVTPRERQEEATMSWWFNVSGMQVYVSGIRFLRGNIWRGAYQKEAVSFMIQLRRTSGWRRERVLWGGGGIEKQWLQARTATGTMKFSDQSNGAAINLPVSIQTIGCSD